MAKAKKRVKKSRASAASPNMRVIEKLQQTIASDQEKLIKRYEKSVRSGEKNVLRLEAQLAKVQKSRASSKPVRGRKPAKNAVQILQATLQAASAELDQLSLGYKKLLAENKALIAFEKEWKKSGATKKAKKPRKVVATRKSSKAARSTQHTHEISGYEDHARMPQSEMEMAE